MENLNALLPDLTEEQQDEKLKLLKRLERNLTLSQGEEEVENSSHESMDKDMEDSDGEDLRRHKTEGRLLRGMPAEVVPYRDSEITRREDSAADAYENKVPQLWQWAAWWMGIRKDDGFFHFVTLCFAIGALLICYYFYKDWTISLGIGLVTFASLETTGLYYGVVYRLWNAIRCFVPLIGKFRPKVPMADPEVAAIVCRPVPTQPSMAEVKLSNDDE